MASKRLIKSQEFALAPYLSQEEPCLSWRGKGDRISLNSLEWQGIPWGHDILIQTPQHVDFPGLCLLVVTGDDAGDVDEQFGQALADATGSMVATLFDVPNQPIFDRREDDLIAFTFEQFLETGDRAWPLLLPMTKSVGAAIRAISDLCLGIQKFILFGASKRGWTVWLASAARFPGVIGAIPVVFDSLDMLAQAEAQKVAWGDYSPMMEDYSSRGLQELARTEAGQQLLCIVDPIHSLDRVDFPVLLLHGANDAFWTVDAVTRYWDQLPGGSRLQILPNQSHSFHDWSVCLPTITCYLNSRVHDSDMPSVKRVQGGGYQASAGALATTLYRADSPSQVFSEQEWKGSRSTATTREMLPPSRQFMAQFLEAEWPSSRGIIRLTSPVIVSHPLVKNSESFRQPERL